MNTLLDKIKAWPLSLKIGEGLVILMVVIYFVMVMGGGSFTTNFAMMGTVGVSVITAIISVFNKKFLLTGIDLVVAALIFMHYLSIA